MFDKKSENSREEPAFSQLKTVSIPDIFYGGADPQIYHPEKTPAEAPGRAKKTAGWASGGARKNFFHNKKVWYVSAAVFFVAGLALISIYYLKPYFESVSALKNAAAKPEEPAPTGEITAENPPAIPAEEPSESVAAAELSIPTSTESSVLLSFPPSIILDSADADVDSLTDLEEEVFATDSGAWDTDGDGYYDGQEVVNLYNPRGTAPQRLIDSGLAQEYINPHWQYRLYYPINWEAAAVDAAGDQVLFSSISGDYIEVAAIKKAENQPFEDWFAENARGENYADLVSIENVFKQAGYARKDNLVAYFTKEDAVYVIIYHPGAANAIYYRQVMIALTQSFRPTKIFADIPEQPVLPPESPVDLETPSTSTSG